MKHNFQKLMFLINMDEVDVTLDGSLIPTPQLDFGHQIIYYLTNTTMNLFNKIKIYIKTKRVNIELSSMFKIPASLPEFVLILHDCISSGSFVIDGKRMMTVKKILPNLPNIRYSLCSMAQKVLNPETLVVDEPILLELCYDHNKLEFPKVCLSKYPVVPLVQVSSLVHVIEEKCCMY